VPAALLRLALLVLPLVDEPQPAATKAPATTTAKAREILLHIFLSSCC
jgi:hypothetical protein